jgi:hypothetical protein
MSTGEIDEFLTGRSEAVVVALDAGSPPTGAVGRFHYQAGLASFSLSAADPAVDLVGRDPRVCCVVEQFPSYYEIVGVMLHGTAHRREGDEAGAATFDLEVSSVVSFDFAKLLAAT